MVTQSQVARDEAKVNELALLHLPYHAVVVIDLPAKSTPTTVPSNATFTFNASYPIARRKRHRTQSLHLPDVPTHILRVHRAHIGVCVDCTNTTVGPLTLV